jgi:hypothetical protein
MPELILSLQSCKNLQRSSNSRALQSAITVIAACRAPLPHTFAAVSTFTGHSKTKCLLTLTTRFCFLKSEGPLNLKKEYPSEQWQIISFRFSGIPAFSQIGKQT